MKRFAFALALVFALPAFAAEERVKHEFSSDAPVGTVRRVVVEIPSGNLTVRAVAGLDRLAVSGVASRDFDGPKEKAWAQKVVNDSTVEIYTSGSEAIVRRRFVGEADTFRSRFTDFETVLQVPAGMIVDIRTRYGNVTLDGPFAQVDADLRGGEINFTAPRSSVKELNASCRAGEVTTNFGDEIIQKEGLFPGRTHFYNAAGQGRVNLHVTGGKINVTLTK